MPRAKHLGVGMLQMHVHGPYVWQLADCHTCDRNAFDCSACRPPLSCRCSQRTLLRRSSLYRRTSSGIPDRTTAIATAVRDCR